MVDVEDNRKKATTIRRIAHKTFFRKGNRWIDSTVTPEAEKNAIEIKQFSDAYFELTRRQTAQQNQYMVFKDDVTVMLAGQVYHIRRQ